jgi:hypothetical protein
MIIDCEPIYFEYSGKKWLIEFWKGQYGMTTGGEVGVFNTRGPLLNIPGVFNGTFYNSAIKDDMLNISFSLIRNKKIVLTRADKHWWLTGFKLGEFSEPSDLVMNIKIALKDDTMLRAFVQGLKKAGYSDKDLEISGNTLSLKYGKPHSAQPITREPTTDWLIQRKNELLCDKYQELTADYNNTPAKLTALEKKAPKLYETALNIGKNRKVYDEYKSIKDYIK